MDLNPRLKLDSIRAVVITLLVAEHVIGTEPGAGMDVGPDSPWQFGILLGNDVRMPILAAFAGLVYAMRPITGTSDVLPLLRSKARRLLVPMLVVGTTFVLLQDVTDGGSIASLPSVLLDLVFFGAAHFWFLQALFLCLVVVAIVDAINVRPRGACTAIFLLAAGTAAIAWRADPPAIDFFSATKAVTILLPPFLVGVAVHRYTAQILRFRFLVLGIAVASYGAGLFSIFFGTSFPQDLEAARAVLAGMTISGSVLLFGPRFGSVALAWIGRRSFAIFLMHVFATASSRVLLERLGVHVEVTVFVVGLVAGVVIPVLVDLALSRLPMARALVLGERTGGSRTRPAARQLVQIGN